MLRNGAFGFALVFLFLVLMLDLRLAVWVSVGIATAFMGGFLVFGALGVTITMISLFGLIIVLGLVVDDAIVIGENIDARDPKDTRARMRPIAALTVSSRPSWSAY